MDFCQEYIKDINKELNEDIRIVDDKALFRAAPQTSNLCEYISSDKESRYLLIPKYLLIEKGASIANVRSVAEYSISEANVNDAIYVLLSIPYDTINLKCIRPNTPSGHLEAQFFFEAKKVISDLKVPDKVKDFYGEADRAFALTLSRKEIISLF